MRKLIFVCLLIYTSAVLLAIPYTSLGNINIPDAYTLPHLMSEVSFTNYVVQDYPAYGDEDYHYNLAGAINFGLFNRGEVGIVAGNNDLIYANLKVRLINETESIPAIAFGLDNAFSRMGDFDNGLPEADLADPGDYIKNSPYFVVSKSILFLTNFGFMPELEAVFHFGMGKRKFEGKGETVKHASGIFVGSDFRMSQYVGMNIEFDSQNINMGINAYFKNITLRAGLFELEDYFNIKDKNSGNKFAVNVKYTIDNFSSVKAGNKDSYQRDISTTSSPRRNQTTNRADYRQAADEPANENDDALLNELRKITERRKEAEKELEEIRKLLQEE